MRSNFVVILILKKWHVRALTYRFSAFLWLNFNRFPGSFDWGNPGPRRVRFSSKAFIKTVHAPHIAEPGMKFLPSDLAPHIGFY